MKRLITAYLFVLFLTACTGGHRLDNDFLASAQPPITPETLRDEPELWQANPKQVWARLQSLTGAQLRLAANTAHSEIARTWIDLAIISRESGANSAELLPALIAWRIAHPDHPGNALLPDSDTLLMLKSTPPPRHIALLLPLQGPSAHLGKTIRFGFLNAYYTSLKSAHNTKTTLSFYDTSNGQPIRDIYQQAITEGADQVVGPLTRDEVRAISQQSHFEAPVLTLNYTPSGLLSGSTTAVVQFGLAPEDEAIQMAAHARSAGFSRALLIAPLDPWGQRVGQMLSSAWRAAGGQMIDALYFDPSKQLAEPIAHLLKVIPTVKNDTLLPDEHRRQDVDVIFLLASNADGRQIVPLLKFNYAGSLPIYSISTIYTGTPNPTADFDLNSVIFCDIPWVLSATHNSAGRLTAVGHDAWQLATQMARLKALPDFPVNGWTGALTLEPNQHIFRHLTWMKMKNGQPQPENW